MTSSISSMMTSGLDYDHFDDRRQREHLVHLRDIAAMQDRRSLGLLDISAIVARLNGRPASSTTPTLDFACCAV